MFQRVDENYIEMFSLDKIEDCLAKADIVVLTLPLTEETKYMFNAKRLELMKNGSVLVNIARGQIVEEKALINALENKLLGAVLDVFEQEPLCSDSVLWQMENVIITPHNSFVGDGNNNRLFNVIIKNLKY